MLPRLLRHQILGGHQRWSGIGGVATEWDLVEAPSQLLEEWLRDPATLDPSAVERGAQDQHAPFAHLSDTYFYLSFGRLDYYSAIYYTYMWSLAIAKDLFTGFDPTDLRNRQVATRYRETVLAAGGSAPAAATGGWTRACR